MGKSRRHTAAILSSIISDAWPRRGCEGFDSDGGDESDIQSLLHLDDYIDLVIPRGSNELVKAIQRML